MPDPVLALVGPTASGKSDIALDFAARWGAEIVAVDAFTVYRGMDVGTAKPTRKQRDRVPHHAIDLLEPEQECTVQWFQAQARAAVRDVVSRGRSPLLVGGSGLYFRAVVDDLVFPPTDPDVRAALEARHAADPPAAHARLAQRDPAAAARIDPDNLRRVVRALEVIELTGSTFSSWRTAWDEHHSVFPGLAVVGVARDRDDLSARVDQRVGTMLARGLVEECRALAGRRLSRTARQAIGYAEVFEHLTGRLDLATAHEQIRVRTRRYALRQQRWFQADPRVAWAMPEQVHATLLRVAEEAQAD